MLGNSCTAVSEGFVVSRYQGFVSFVGTVSKQGMAGSVRT
jgi:hypothetical protein